jgi:hypothetical protein
VRSVDVKISKRASSSSSSAQSTAQSKASKQHSTAATPSPSPPATPPASHAADVDAAADSDADADGDGDVGTEMDAYANVDADTDEDADADFGSDADAQASSTSEFRELDLETPSDPAISDTTASLGGEALQISSSSQRATPAQGSSPNASSVSGPVDVNAGLDSAKDDVGWNGDSSSSSSSSSSGSSSSTDVQGRVDGGVAGSEKQLKGEEACSGLGGEEFESEGRKVEEEYEVGGSEEEGEEGEEGEKVNSISADKNNSGSSSNNMSGNSDDMNSSSSSSSSSSGSSSSNSSGNPLMDVLSSCPAVDVCGLQLEVAVDVICSALSVLQVITIEKQVINRLGAYHARRRLNAFGSSLHAKPFISFPSSS